MWGPRPLPGSYTSALQERYPHLPRHPAALRPSPEPPGGGGRTFWGHQAQLSREQTKRPHVPRQARERGSRPSPPSSLCPTRGGARHRLPKTRLEPIPASFLMIQNFKSSKVFLCL